MDTITMDGTEYHVTAERSTGLYGHATAHCDDAGCSGDERFLVGVGSVTATEEEPEEGEGVVYWVAAKIGGQSYRFFAAPRHTSSGISGLEPCGSSIDDWCPVELRDMYGDDAAAWLGREAIAKARV